MTRVPAPSRRTDAPTPLDREGVRRSRRVLGRLHAALRSVWRELPDDARTAVGAAKRLGIERTTCQRIGYVIHRDFDLESILERLPGHAGLAMFARAVAAARVASEQSRRELDAALGESEALWRQLGGSARALAGRLGVSDLAVVDPQQSDPAGSEERAQHHELSARIAGRRIAHNYLCALIVPGTDPRTIVSRKMHALLGIEARPGAVPLTIASFRDRFDGADLGPDEVYGEPMLVPRFSTMPAPLVPCGDAGSYLVQRLEDKDGPRLVDVTRLIVSRVDHPGLDSGDESVTLIVHMPARRLTIDLIVDESLRLGATPLTDVVLWLPGSQGASLDDAWQTRFDWAPALRVHDPASPCDATTDTMRDWLLDESGVDPSTLVGYRIDVEHPVWRTAYRLGLRRIAAPPSE